MANYLIRRPPVTRQVPRNSLSAHTQSMIAQASRVPRLVKAASAPVTVGRVGSRARR